MEPGTISGRSQERMKITEQLNRFHAINIKLPEGSF